MAIFRLNYLNQVQIAANTLSRNRAKSIIQRFPNALNPYKHYLIHQQGGREVFPVALFYCSRFIAFFEP